MSIFKSSSEQAYFSRAKKSVLTVFLLFLSSLFQIAIAQTGNIFLNSTGVGSAAILDPGNDDYITASGGTFSLTVVEESDEFDATFHEIWCYANEPTADLQTGSTCGATEIVDNPNTGKHAAYYRFIDPDNILDNGDEILMFRMRIGSNPGNAGFGYSILLDTDLGFGNTGPGADVNYMPGNPGFEFEILYGAGNNNGVEVNDVDGVAAANQVTTLASYPTTQRHQRSYAALSNCGGTPVFLDFYINYSTLGISATTPLRMAFATSSSPSSALGGSASDIGGVDDDNFVSDDAAFINIITNSPIMSFAGGYNCVATYTVSNDTTICSGDNITLGVNLTSPAAGVTYAWSTGATTSSISVSPLTSTTYTVSVTDSVGTCVDSVVVTVPSAGVYNVNFEQVKFGGAGVTITPKVGNGQNQGDIILYENVITVGCQQIDCIVVTDEVTNVGSWQAYDQPSTGTGYTNNEPEFFSPQLNFSQAGEVVFDFQFIAAGSYDNNTNTGTPVTLQNVYINTYDIDGNGSSGTNQYNEFGGFLTYELGNPTNIEVSYNQASNLTLFRSNTSSNTTNALASNTRIRVNYATISDFTIAVGAEAGGLAYFFLDFSVGPVFTGAQVFSAPTLDLNGGLAGINHYDTLDALTPLPFSLSGANITSVTDSVDYIEVRILSSQLVDGQDENIYINGATVGDTFNLDFANLPAGAASDLIISEYGEGSSNNKYIEIYNGTGATVNLTNYRLRLGSNGSAFSSSYTLTGTLPNGQTVIIAHGSASNSILNAGNVQTNSSVINFNGDDAVGLEKNIGGTWTLIDIIGVEGVDPGSGWNVAGTSNATANRVLVRKINVCNPNINWSISAGTNPANSEWLVFANEMWDSLSNHTMVCGPQAIQVVLNGVTYEVLPSISGLDNIFDVTGINGVKLSTAQAEAFIDAMNYLNTGAQPTNTIREFENTVYLEPLSSAVATFTVYPEVVTPQPEPPSACATYTDTCTAGDSTFYSFTYTLLNEDFEVDNDGWTMNGAVTPAIRHEGGPGLGGNYFLGRFGNGQSVQKTFDLNSKSHRLAFDIYRLDSWDNESLQIYVGDGTTLLFSQSFNGNANVAGQTYTGAVSGYSYNIVTTTSANIVYFNDPNVNGWQDQIIRVYIDVPSGIPSMTLKVTSTLNQSAGDESWGLDNFSIACTQFDVPAGVNNVDVFVVGGGGGGGVDGGPGGGGGEIRFGTIDVSAISTLTALPARGGRGDLWWTNIDNAGDASQIRNGSTVLYSANGGTGGGGFLTTGQNPGGSGGIGGTGVQGANGGTGVNNVCTTGGSGSNGTSSDISCTSITYAGGGGGGIGVDVNNSTPFLGPAGGAGGGGRGANYRLAFDGTTVITGSTYGGNGTDGTGGGGGGGSACNSGTTNSVNQRTGGGFGGSGTVIIRYAIVSYNVDITSQSLPTCNGAADGAITATVTGGDANFNYYWSNNQTTLNTSATTNTLSGLTAGIYTVTVVDANGDSAITSFTLTEPAALNVAATVTSQETCVDANDGSITLAVNGGTVDSTKTYAFDGGTIPANITTYGNASFVSNGGITGGRMRLVPNSSSAQGSFYLDSLVSTDNHLNISFDFKMSADGDGFHMALTDLANAQATPNQGEENIATNSTSTGFELAFEDIVTDQAYIAYNNVTLGTYTFGSEVLDGPWHHVDVYLNNGIGTVVFNNTDTIFDGVTLTGFAPQDAYVKFAARNGAAASEQSIDNLTIGKPLLFNWSNGSTAQNLTSLAPGTYSVTVTDANGCTDSTSVNIIEYSAPTVLALDTVIACNSGNISITANGVGTFLWSNGATTASIDALASGIYYVTLTDNSCQIVDSIAVSIMSTIKGSTDLTACFGDEVLINAPQKALRRLTDANGLPSDVYWYIIGNDTFQAQVDGETDGGGWTLALNYVHLGGTNPALSVLSDRLPLIGSSLLGTDESNIATYWGHAGNQLMDSLNPQELRFYGITSGHNRVINFKTSMAGALNYVQTGTGSMSGINNPANYTVLPGHTAFLPAQTNLNVGNAGDFALTAFPYYRNAAYHWGINASNRWEVDDYPNNSSRSTIHRVWVKGDNLTPGILDVEYLWSTGDTTASISVTPNTTTQYTVTFTDGIGTCIDTIGVTISAATFNFNQDTVASCGLDTVTIDAGAGWASYSWSTGETTQIGSFGTSGAYYLTVTDSAGCSASDTVAVSVINMNRLSNDTAICIGDSVMLVFDGVPGEALLAAKTQSSNYNDGCSLNTLESLSDNDFNTAVSTNNASSENITIELGEATIIDSIQIAPLSSCGWGPAYLNGKTVSVSTDGITYTLLGTISGTQNNVLINPSINFPNSLVKYIRFNSVGWISISELRVYAQNGQSGFEYLWSTGDTTSSIFVSPSVSSQYFLTITDGISACIDTVEVTVNNPAFAFNQDTVASCGLDTVTIDAGAGWASYSWSNGETTQMGSFGTSGAYYLTVVDSAGCSASDTVAVSVINMNNVTSDTAICIGDSVTLSFGTEIIEGLVVYYPFDGNATDEGPNGINGTLNGAVSATTDRNGNANSALLFANSGSDRNVLVNSPATFAGTTDFTYGMWVHPLAYSGFNTYFENGQWSGQTILLRQESSSVIMLYMNGNTVGSINYAPPLFQWTHLSLVRSGGLISLYVNGNLQGNFNTNYTNTFTPTLPMKIGSSTHVNGQYYKGSIDDFAVFNRALTLEEIGTLYQNGPIQVSPFQFTWSTGDTTSAITVAPTTTTQYVLTVTDGIGTCSDTVEVMVMNPVFSMGFDTTATYTQDSIVLDAGAGWSTYSWSSGETTQTANITASQEVIITVGDSFGCEVSDTVVVSIINLSNATGDTAICVGDSVELNTALNTGLDLTGLAAYYNFENGATDLSPNANNLTVLGPTLVNDVYGNAYSFDGNDRLNLPTQTGLPLGNTHYTITAYIKPSAMGSRGIIGWGSWGQSNRVNAVRLYNNGLINYWWGNDISAPTANLTGQWHKVAATFDGTTRRLFLNGVQVAQDSPAGKNTNFNDFNIGRTNGGEWFLGLIDNVSIWTRALSVDEINAVDGTVSEVNYTFLWSTGDTTASITVAPTTPTTYTVTVSDGFTSTVDTITVGASQPTLTADVTPTDCEGTQNGTINTTVTGGALPYQYAWSNAATSANLTALGVGTYNVTVTDSAGCSVDSAFVISDVDTIAPTALAGETFLYLDANGDAVLTFLAADSGSIDNCGIDSVWFSTSEFDCDDIGIATIQMAVFDTAGNGDTTSFTLHIEDTLAPVVLGQNLTIYLDANGNASVTVAQVNNGSTDNCGIDTLYLSDYDFDCNDVGANNVVLTVEDLHGNVKSETYTITVEDTISPLVVAQNLTVYLDASGNATITPAQINNGSSDNCGISTYSLSVSSFNCADTGSNSVVLTVNDVNGNSASITVLVTVLDTISPTMGAQSLTVYLDGNGDASITTAMVDNGTTDNCSIAQLTLSETNFDCADVGPNNITFTATDVSGNSNTATVVVTVLDTISPLVSGQNLTVYLDGNGDASITTAQVVTASSDNCNIDTVYLSDYDFDCADVGANTITLTAEDVNGNTSSVNVTITVLDTIAPAVAGQSFSVWLDANGVATITAGEVNNGSADNCGIAAYSLSTSTFNCADTGANTVFLNVTDNSGNTGSGIVTINVLDTMAPAVVVQNLTIYLDANGEASITTGMVDLGTTDNCGLDQISLSITDFDCNDVGTNNILFTATDVNGNVKTQTVVITVLDTILPTVSAQNLTVYLDANGEASVTPAAINTGSFDNCGIGTLSLSQSNFDCGDVGANLVTFTVTDNNGNTDDVNITITVLDTTLPSVLTQNITVYLDNSGNASIIPFDVDAASFDNCAIDSMLVLPNTFNCGDTGVNTVVLTIWDEHGNVDSATAQVTVLDTFTPFVVTNNLVLTLDPNGEGFITVQDIDSIVSDACGIASMSLDIDSFDCSNIGANTVTLTVIDVNGNITNATSIITVIDTVNPTAVAQNLVVYLDSSGLVTIDANMVDSASFDNCGIDTMFLSESTFTCANVGLNTITLYVQDGSGNLDSTSFVVEVLDTISPTIDIQNIVVALDSNGSASISVLDVNIGTADNCALDTLFMSQYDFNCNELGSNTLMFYAVDIYGNTDSASFTVTVIDTIAPVLSVKDTVLYLNASGSISLEAAWFDNGSTDNCSIDSIYLSSVDLTCANVDTNIIIFYAQDQSGNVSSVAVNVTIVDTIAPSITCPASFATCDTIVEFELPVVFDECGVANFSQTFGPASGDFFPEGITSVGYEVVDQNGNVAVCNFDVERYPTPVIKAPADTTVYFAEPISLEPMDSLVVDYFWTPSIYLSAQDVKSPDANPETDITYMVTGTSANGCEVSDEINITVLSELRFAQAFSPNGDGENDVFYIEGIQMYPGCKVTIVNRYGLRVFESLGYPDPWDGTFKGADLPVGSYFFVVVLEEGGAEISGTITIIR